MEIQSSGEFNVLVGKYYMRLCFIFKPRTPDVIKKTTLEHGLL